MRLQFGRDLLLDIFAGSLLVDGEDVIKYAYRNDPGFALVIDGTDVVEGMVADDEVVLKIRIHDVDTECCADRGDGAVDAALVHFGIDD